MTKSLETDLLVCVGLQDIRTPLKAGRGNLELKRD